jgi:tetratricopeptide (TPR) repeat protein
MQNFRANEFPRTPICAPPAMTVTFPDRFLEKETTTMRSRKLLASVAAGAFALALPVAVALAAGSSSTPAATGSAAADGEYKMAQASITQADYPTAVTHLQNVLAATPDNADALNLMGFSERKMGKMDESLAYYNKALALNPNHLGANEYLGELYLDMKNIDKAKERLEVLKNACGGTCAEYTELKEKIEQFKS